MNQQKLQTCLKDDSYLGGIIDLAVAETLLQLFPPHSTLEGNGSSIELDDVHTRTCVYMEFSMIERM